MAELCLGREQKSYISFIMVKLTNSLISVKTLARICACLLSVTFFLGLKNQNIYIYIYIYKDFTATIEQLLCHWYQKEVAILGADRSSQL